MYFIDDDPIIVFISKKLMAEIDYSQEIKEFDNGKSAIEALITASEKDQQIPAIIFVDLSMPIMNGWEFLENFQKAKIKNKENITIVVLSSSISASEIEMVKGYPIVQDYIVKPITPADLNKINSSIKINE
ncbi:response regulator [Cellulophaga baltica]|nr:response regulator [Cellulophaga baltica]